MVLRPDVERITERMSAVLPNQSLAGIQRRDAPRAALITGELEPATIDPAGIIHEAA